MYFITIPAVKEQFKTGLTKVRTDESGWIMYFYDKNEGVEWVEYYPYQEDRAPSILKRTDLPDDLESMMVVCLSSDDAEDWRGLGAELSSGEYDVNEIAKVLRENFHKWSDTALRVFKDSYKRIDNRNIIGMNIDEVEKSYREFINAQKDTDNLIK